MSRSEFTILAAPIAKAWDSSNPRLYFSSFYNIVLDAAARMTDYPDMIMAAVMNEQANGDDHVPPQKPNRPEYPDIPTGTTAAATVRADFQHHMKIYGEDLKIYQEYNAALSAILHAIHDALPPSVQPLIKVNNNLRDQTPFGALQILEYHYGSLVNNEIQIIMRELNDPLPVGKSIEAHIARHREIHRTLQEHGQGLPNNMQVNLIIATLPPSFSTFIERYNENHPGLNRDFGQFSNLLMATTADKLTYGVPAMANAATSTPTLDSVMAELAALKVLLAESKNSKPAFKYCWSHGPNKSHNSADCRFPTEGHQRTATDKNKQGGKTSKNKA